MPSVSAYRQTTPPALVFEVPPHLAALVHAIAERVACDPDTAAATLVSAFLRSFEPESQSPETGADEFLCIMPTLISEFEAAPVPAPWATWLARREEVLS
jgi:hypothetical protein